MGMNVVWTWVSGVQVGDLLATGLVSPVGPIGLEEAEERMQTAVVDTDTGVLIFDPEARFITDLHLFDPLSQRSAGLVIGDTGHVFGVTLRQDGVERSIREDQHGSEVDEELLALADPDGSLREEFWAERFSGYFVALTGADPMSQDYLEPDAMQAVEVDGAQADEGHGAPASTPAPAAQPEAPRAGFLSRLFGRR